MAAFNIWSENPPPLQTWVWVKYKLVGDNWQLVRTCRRGCCVHSLCGCMTLPKYWRLATEAEATAEQALWNNSGALRKAWDALP